MASAFSTLASPLLEVVVDSEEEECVWSNSSTSSESDLVSNLATRVCPADSTTSTSMALAVAAKELAFGKLLHERQCASSTPDLSFLKQQPPIPEYTQHDLCCSALSMKQACLQRLFAPNHQLANLWSTNSQLLNWNQIQLGENVAASNALLSAASLAQQCDIYSLHNFLPKTIPVQSTNSCFSTPASLEEHSLKKCSLQISPEPQCTLEQASSATKTNSLKDKSHSPSTDIFLNSLSKNKLGRAYNPGRPLGMQDRRKILQLYQKGFKISHIAKLIGVTHSCVSKIMTRYRRTGSMNPKTQLSRKMSVCSAIADVSPVAKHFHVSSSASSSSCPINGSQLAQGCDWVNGRQLEMLGNASRSLFMPQAAFTSLFNGFNNSATLFDSPQLHRNDGLGVSCVEAVNEATMLMPSSGYFINKPIPLVIHK